MLQEFAHAHPFQFENGLSRCVALKAPHAGSIASWGHLVRPIMTPITHTGSGVNSARDYQKGLGTSVFYAFEIPRCRENRTIVCPEAMMHVTHRVWLPLHTSLSYDRMCPMHTQFWILSWTTGSSSDSLVLSCHLSSLSSLPLAPSSFLILSVQLCWPLLQLLQHTTLTFLFIYIFIGNLIWRDLTLP